MVHANMILRVTALTMLTIIDRLTSNNAHEQTGHDLVHLPLNSTPDVSDASSDKGPSGNRTLHTLYSLSICHPQLVSAEGV